MMSGDQFGAGYRLVNNEIIQAAVMDKFSLADWRYLFWLSQRAAAGAAAGELLNEVWDDTPANEGLSESGPDWDASQDNNRLSSPVYRMALDIIGRAIALRRPPVNDDKIDFMPISEAATLRGVSRQAINHLIATNRVEFIREGRTVLIHRGSIEALRAHPRKRAAGQQILIYGDRAFDRLRRGDGVIHTLPRTVVAQVGIRPGFGYTALHAGVRLNERAMDELARAGVQLKGQEAYREWLETTPGESATDAVQRPSLASMLRSGGVWRLCLSKSEADQPIIAQIFSHPDLEHTSCAVWHGIMLENCGFLDVKLRDDAGKKAVAAFPDIARAKCRSVQDTAEILSTQNKATTWCKEMRDAFAAALRQAIAGLDPPETVKGSPLLDPELFLVLLTIVEAGYTEFQGIAKPEYWIDLRGALRIRDDGTGPMLQLLPMREILSAVKAARRNSNAAKFVGSLYEFYGLRLVVERRGWTAAEIMQLLPNLIRSDRWIRYKKFASSPASHTRKR